MSIKRIGVLTGGGDCSGLNAAIRAITKCAVLQYGATVIGIRDGFEGLLGHPRIISLTQSMVQGLLARGGTILGSTNKGDPFAYKSIEGDRICIADRSDEVIENFRNLELDVLIVIGGDGTNAIGWKLQQRGLPVIGLPKTIDNDLDATDVTFGFDTAVNVVAEAIDRLQTTAESHHRVMLVETMGRNVGWIAVQAGLAGGAHIILIPEIPFHVEKVAEAIRKRQTKGRNFTIICVAEGAMPSGGDAVVGQIVADSTETIRYGGISRELMDWLEPYKLGECRATDLGHIQRGGAPTAFDRNLATRLGVYAVHCAARGESGVLVVLKNTEAATIPLADALEKIRRVDPDGKWVSTARDIGISFGDE